MTAPSGVQTLQKMKIYSILKSVKAEKNASFHQTGLLKTSPPLPPPFPLPLLPPWEKRIFHHQGSCLSPGLYGFTIGTILHTDFLLEQFSGHHAAATKNWFTASAIWLIAHPPFLSNFIPVDFFLFPKANGQLHWPLICPGEPQDDLGRGQQKSHHRDVHRHVPPLV